MLISSCFHVEDIIQRGMNNNDLHVKEGVFLVKQWPAGDKMRNGLLVWQEFCDTDQGDLMSAEGRLRDKGEVILDLLVINATDYGEENMTLQEMITTKFRKLLSFERPRVGEQGAHKWKWLVVVRFLVRLVVLWVFIVLQNLYVLSYVSAIY